ncbi:MAG: helix-hairpin-helix domain-containing protein [Cytophagales bacterium]|nr:helix-hairpin-helix domain-containing protein [Cytophagales bacterium]
MQNAEIIRLLELTARLLELNDENPFKVRNYTNAAVALERVSEPLENLNAEQIAQLDGLSKGMADKIVLLNTEGTFPELRQLLAQVPGGVVEMLDIKGLGPKKIRALWKDLGIETLDELLAACADNRVAALKGFGEKTQENIRQALVFRQAAASKLRFDEASTLADMVFHELRKAGLQTVYLTGQVAQCSPVVDSIQLVAAVEDVTAAHAALAGIEWMHRDDQASGPFAWRGRMTDAPLPVEVLFVPPQKFVGQAFVHTAAAGHLAKTAQNGQTLLQVATSETHQDEEQIYTKAGLPYIVPEMREGLFEFEWAKNHSEADLVKPADLKGVLHNHSTYSDGKHTLEEMARYCQSLGYEYFGITDHSKSAFYANGLTEDRVRQQHQEIDALNQKLAPFRIFKGIESDILTDGSLDYDDDVLKTFDFIVASVHSGLGMDEEKATKRLIRAVENPYTTILGHMTGRLLLRREGYPVDHRKVIDACAANGVIIEINASPWRLDIDWHWLPYCMEKGVMISINPDAHEKNGIHDMAYGVNVARKGGLTRAMTFNALPLAEVGKRFGV